MTGRILARMAFMAVLSMALPALGVCGWEPSQPIELVVAAGMKGGADQMARMIASIAEQEKLCPQPIRVVNKAGDQGAEAYLYALQRKGDPHTLLIPLSSLFTLPIVKGAAFSWNDLTPISRLALDQFVLWVRSDSPYKTAPEFLEAVRKAPMGQFKMGGTGTAQEDPIVTIMLERASPGARFTYVPLGGGGEVAAALADGRVEATLNNPAEANEFWKQGKVRPLGVAGKARLTGARWAGIPTLKEQKIEVEYEMMRAVFGAPAMPADAVSYYVEFLRKVQATKAFRDYMTSNALVPAWQSGDAFRGWVSEQNDVHVLLLRKVGMK